MGYRSTEWNHCNLQVLKRLAELLAHDGFGVSTHFNRDTPEGPSKIVIHW